MYGQSPTVHIYLSAPGEDLAGERELFSRVVLPELQRRAASVSFRVEGIDPEQLPPKEQGLDQRLREIERCRPFFVAILGERAGALVSPPADLAATSMWPERAGHGLQEIEILFALFTCRVRWSFFYRRDPSFLVEVPEADRRSFLSADDEEATRAAALADWLRASGRPLLDGYAFLWQTRSDPAAAFPELARRLIDDLWPAILEEVVAARAATPACTPSSQPPHLPPDRALPFHEDVQFTVYRPRTVRPLEWAPLLAFAHLGELPLGADPQDDPIRQVEQRARAILGDRVQAYTSMTQDSTVAVPDEAEITFVLHLPDFRVKGPRRTFLWINAVHLEEFQIQAGAPLNGQTARGSLAVYHGSILLARVQIAIRVDAQAPQRIPMNETPATATPFRKIFASYSHKDTPIVLQFERFVEALGDRYLRDVRELRAGEIWSERLCEFIREADVFQLFWSRNAMESSFVEREWRYALALQRPQFIRPTYWEEPMPKAPGLPPEELGRIHFHPLGSASPSDKLSDTPEPQRARRKNQRPHVRFKVKKRSPGSFCMSCGEPLTRCLCRAEECSPGVGMLPMPSPPSDIDPLPKPNNPRRFIPGAELVAYIIIAGILTTFDLFSFGGGMFGLGGLLLVTLLVLRDFNGGTFSISRRVSGTQIVDQRTGRRASNIQTVLRNVYYIAPLAIALVLPMAAFLALFAAALFLVIDLVMILVSRHGRRLGDFLAGTQVVERRG